MSRTASVETIKRGERSHVHPTSKMIDPKIKRIILPISQCYINVVAQHKVPLYHETVQKDVAYVKELRTTIRAAIRQSNRLI